MGASYSVYHAACLAANMPPDASLYVDLDPSLAWGSTDYLLAQIEHDLRMLAWMLAGGSKSKSPKPKPIENPAERAKRTRNSSAPTKEEMNAVADALGIPEDRR